LCAFWDGPPNTRGPDNLILLFVYILSVGLAIKAVAWGKVSDATERGYPNEEGP